MPLQGISVLVTRPDYAAQPLVEMITTAGGRAIRQAGVDILPTTNESHRRQLCGPAAQIAIFTSRPAVRFGLSNFLACDWSQQTEILAIGPATAAEVERRGLLTTAFASQSNSESLLTLPLLQRPKGQRILIFGAPGGRTLIQRELSQRGALVDSIQVYQRQPAQLCNDALQQILHDFERLVVSVSNCCRIDCRAPSNNARWPSPAPGLPQRRHKWASLGSRSLNRVLMQRCYKLSVCLHRR